MLENKVVVVSGGAGLIGQAFIRSIIEHNGFAVIADINSKLGNKVKSDLSNELQTENIEFVEIDIISKNKINDAISLVNSKFHKIDALVNNAYPRNINYGKHFFEVELEDFIQNTSANLGGYFLTSQQFANYFRTQGYGNIVNISSIYGVAAPKFEIYKNTTMTVPVEYAAIKSAQIHLTQYMAKYFKGLNIRVNSLSPGGVQDNQPESFLRAYKEECLSKGMLDADDLTGTLVYLLSDYSQYINGQNIIVDDGFCL